MTFPGSSSLIDDGDEYDDCGTCDGWGRTESPYGGKEDCRSCFGSGRVLTGRSVPCGDMCDGDETDCDTNSCMHDKPTGFVAFIVNREVG